MALKFHSIKWRNFLSTGNQFSEVKLDTAQTTLIVGENGSGKSTILDAICYGLFNKPFRDINKPQLVNSINQKQLTVEIEFSVGAKLYKVVRGIKPSIFEIYLNGELINQDAAARDYQKYLEEHVLKLNYKSFTQIVILGSATFTPFMQLTTASRREVIEDLLDIKIFSTMNEVLKYRQGEVKTKIQDIDNNIHVGKKKIEIQVEYVKTLESDKKERIGDIQKRIVNINEESAAFEKQVNTLKVRISELTNTITDKHDICQKISKLENLKIKIQSKIKSKADHNKFYHDHASCPTCNQDLPEELKSSTIEKNDKEIKELEAGITTINTEIETLIGRLNEIRAIESQINSLQLEQININNKILANQQYVQKLNEELDKIQDEQGNISEEKGALKEMARQVVEMSEKKTELSKEKHYLDVAGLLLKDTGIKTMVIRQYLPIINKLVNKYLQAMDFFVAFELDETFTETIKSRHRDVFSYASFSEGEKARIDISILLAFRSIARMKNTTNTNLLLMDEVFDSSLDVNGSDFVMNLFNMLDDETNIFVISHRDALFDKFNSVIRFDKKNNFSVITS